MTYHRRKGATRWDMKIWRAATILFILLNVLALCAMWKMSLRVEPADLVYDICNESRISPYIKEHGCGALEEQLKLDFRCKEHNRDPDNYCWVEER